MPFSFTRRQMLAAAAAGPLLRLPRQIRVVIVGTDGHVGEVLGPLDRLPDVRLVAATVTRPRKLPDGVKLYDDYRKMLDQEKPDIVVVCGRTDTRAQEIVESAGRKHHIVAEKPLAIEAEDLARVKKAVADNGVDLTMLLPMRFVGHYAAMRDFVARGAIGEVAQMQSQKSYQLGERPDWMLKRKSFGGAIPYIGIHMVDLMRFVGGREFTETVSYQAHIGFPDYGEMENTTGSLFKLDNGGVALLHMDYLRPAAAPSHGDDRLRVVGTKGVIEYQMATGLTLVTGTEKPRQVSDLPARQSLFVDFLNGVYHRARRSLTLEDIYKVSEIVLAARDSAEKGRIIRL
ncbi:MAG: Gfo/Idh/MocA family oxidoreductase [Bryobacterales bacterium]|nr:Gfo/Idh/MocA family oxidoreductase [Bryobacterales bacterium]